jgi:pyruvate-formate lyase-activating enzyme
MINKTTHPKKVPFLLYSNAQGEIFEDITTEVAGRSANKIIKLTPQDFIELPEGSDFFRLPGRTGIGFDTRTGAQKLCRKGEIVSAFVAPAHTQLYFSAYEKKPDAPLLPLYAYTAIGWLNNKFYTTAVRIDPDIRQDCDQFDQKIVVKNAEKMIKANPGNRLLSHIGHCATVYICPAARNYFLNRWEAPLPTSPTCNSNCLGCISYQPKDTEIKSTQNRISFVPSPEEIAEIAIAHLETAPLPVVSFGQGCEGEPLLVWQTIKDAIILIRKKTKKGIINLNTNGSKPDAVEELCRAGLDSIRVSINSAIKEYYNSYYCPNNYSFEDVIDSIKIVTGHKKWASVNYFTFPGMTDSVKEHEEFRKIITHTNLSMIQWRNFNIDPDWYLEKINYRQNNDIMGMQTLLRNIHEEFPGIYFGYFNPPAEIINKFLGKS